MPSMFVDKWKAQDTGDAKAKSRLVVLGWKDPDIMEIRRSAPTPTAESFTALLAWLAGRGYDGYASDLKNAFAQARNTTR